MGSAPAPFAGTRHCDPMRLGIIALVSYVGGWPVATSSDFLEPNLPVVIEGAAGCQPDCEGPACFQHTAWTNPAGVQCVEEAVDLGPISGREAIDEVLVARF